MEKRVAELERTVAELRLRLVDLLPREMGVAPAQPTLGNLVAQYAQCIAMMGGKKVVHEWGLERLYADTSVDASQVVNMVRYPVAHETIDTTQFVFVTGPGPVNSSAEPDKIPEHGRIGVFPLLVAARIAFFNGQLPLACSNTWMAVYMTQLRQSSALVISLYEQPWPSWFETAVFLWGLGQGNANMYVVQQGVLDATLFNAGEGLCANVAGAANCRLTMRQRQLSVYGVLQHALRLYVEHTKSTRVFGDYWEGENSLGRLIVETGRMLVQPAVPIGYEQRKEIGAQVFAQLDSGCDVVVYLKHIFLMSLYVNATTARDKHVFNEVCGDARALLAGFVCSDRRDAHCEHLEPLVYFLRGLVADAGVPVIADWHS